MIEEDRIILHAGVWADSRQLGSILSDIGAAGLINATGFSAKYEDAPFFLRQLAAEGHIGLDAEGRGCRITSRAEPLALMVRCRTIFSLWGKLQPEAF